MTALLALLSSVLWGSADFYGGTMSRRIAPVVVVVLSQAAGLLGIGVVAVVTATSPSPWTYLPWAVLSGVCGMVGLVAFYAALAAGTMGVVSPIAALGVIVPVAVGLVRGEHPSSLQLVGVAVAIGGVVLASGPELRGAAGVRPVLLAALAAVGFGAALLFIAYGSRTSPTMTLVAMRVTSVLALGSGILVGRAARPRRLPAPGIAPVRVRDLPAISVVGLGDVFANLSFGVAASRSGKTGIVAVLGSLYPVATVVLARLVHGERLGRAQLIGVGGALVGVALIGVGGGTG